MRPRSLIELTPLLDIVLIFSFVLIIRQHHTALLQGSEQERLRRSVAELEGELARKEELLRHYKADVDSSSLRIMQYEEQLSAQTALMEDALVQMSDRMADFFDQEELRLRSQKAQGKLQKADYQNFQDRLRQFVPDQETELIRKVYTLQELAAYATIIPVYVSSQNEILLDDQPTGIWLRDFDEAKGDFAEGLGQKFEERLYQRLEQDYERRKKSPERVGEVVLLTFGHSRQAMRGVLLAARRQTSRFFQQLRLREANARKVFYADMGFYPMQEK